MTKRIFKSEKTSNLSLKINQCLDDDLYKFTNHALERKEERIVEIPDILYVLRNGIQEKSKDKWDEKFQSWNYSIRGKTIDDEALRIIVSFDDYGMLIITVIRLEG